MARIAVGQHDDESPSDRREHPRYAVRSVAVDYSDGETFLFAYIENISEMGIFLHSTDPLPIGTNLALRFTIPSSGRSLELEGVVMWVNAVRADGNDLNPGMGIRFANLTADQRELLVEFVRTIAYLQRGPTN